MSCETDEFIHWALDPQSFSRISSNQYIGLNTRLHSRDNYKQKLPVIKDQSRHLPPASEFKSPMDEFLGFAAHLQKKPAQKPAQKPQPKKENFSSGGCGCN